TANWFPLLIYLYNWPDKLIGHSVLIGFLKGGKNIHGLFPLPVYQRVVSNLHPFPTFVTVHGIIPSHHRGYFPSGFAAMVLDVLQVSQAAFGISVPAICKSMNKYPLHPIGCSSTTKSP